jgi:hypothetical protein
MKDHVKILGILHIALGGLICLGGLMLFLIFAGAAGIVGATGDHDLSSGPFQNVAPGALLAIIGVALGAVLVVLGIPGVIGGWGLIHYKGWARILVIILSILHLPGIPIGTAIGVYGLWVLFNDDTKRLFGAVVPVGYAPPPVAMG